MNAILRRVAMASVMLLGAAGAGAAPDLYQPQAYVRFDHAEWTRNATIYQINTRQFTPEGTFRSAEKQLPRLKELGVDILWLMPIHPIGQQNRKGTLGSPYAVSDHRAVNPEFGTLEDFRHFVAAAHKLGLHVILDWVGNHTAWDSVLFKQHPEWYERDADGKPHPTPWYDWDDIIDLDYSKPALRRYMTESMLYWVRDVGVDGYRVDAAGLTPLDFWEQASRELRKVKPVFMLAEWESRDMHAKAFDASYAWTWWDGMKAIAEGKADASSLNTYYAWNEKFYPKQAYRMLYTTNHDKNAWEGTEFEIFGPAVDSAIVFSFISEGMPMIYNGQEVGNHKRLAFFERDAIAWRPSPYEALYKNLLALKKQNTALWNGQWGAPMVQVPNALPKQVFSFVRQNSKDKVFAVFNLSGKPAQASFKGVRHHGNYRDFSSGEALSIGADSQLTMAPWSYRIFVQ
jgi:glycosidase